MRAPYNPDDRSNLMILIGFCFAAFLVVGAFAFTLRNVAQVGHERRADRLAQVQAELKLCAEASDPVGCGVQFRAIEACKDISAKTDSGDRRKCLEAVVSRQPVK